MTAGEAVEDDLALRAECRLKLDSAMALPIGEDSARRALLDEAGRLEGRIVDDTMRGNIGLERGRYALVAGLFDLAIDALTAARSAYERQGRMPRAVGDCWTQLARAHVARQEFGAGLDALLSARAAFAAWGLPDAEIKLAETAAAIARRLTGSGRHVEALRVLDEMDDGDPGYWGTVLLARAEVLANQGMYTAAERALKSAESCDETADVNVARGVVLACSGRYGPAVAALEAAVDRYTELIEQAQRAAPGRRSVSIDRTEAFTTLRSKLATAQMNLGAVHGALGQRDQARQRYADALGVLTEVSAADQDVLACRLNLGVEAMESGDADEALRVFTGLEETLARVPEQLRLRAGLAMNFGRLLHRVGRAEDAVALHVRARLLFLEQNRPEWAARAALNLGTSLAESAPVDDPGDQALAELLPALLYVDTMRFQFPTSAARMAWRATVAGASRLAFELAADDPRLLSELIEHAVNSGVHSTRAVDGTSALECAERLGTMGDPAPVTGTAPTMGAQRLMAGAVLPMHPPPQLRMAQDNIALGAFRSSSRDVYGEMFTTARVIDSVPPDAVGMPV